MNGVSNQSDAANKYEILVAGRLAMLKILSKLFASANKFNDDISGWDTNNVRDMSECLMVPQSSIKISISGILKMLLI